MACSASNNFDSFDRVVETLTTIPSTFGRLVYLASAYQTTTGRYAGAVMHDRWPPRDDADDGLHHLLKMTVQEWLNLPAHLKVEDYRRYWMLRETFPADSQGR